MPVQCSRRVCDKLNVRLIENRVKIAENQHLLAAKSICGSELLSCVLIVDLPVEMIVRNGLHCPLPPGPVLGHIPLDVSHLKSQLTLSIPWKWGEHTRFILQARKALWSIGNVAKSHRLSRLVLGSKRGKQKVELRL